MHLHGAIANQTALSSAAAYVPAQKKGGSLVAQQAGGSSTAQKKASEDAAQAAQVKPNGLFFALKTSVGRKSSDDEQDESNPGDSAPALADGNVTKTNVEEETASSPDNAAPHTAIGQLYTARGALSAAPSQAGGVFEATV